MTAYNWETNDSNAGADYFNQNDNFLGGGNTPEWRGGAGPRGGAQCRRRHDRHHAADRLRGRGPEWRRRRGAQTPNYLATRFHQSPARKGSAFALTPDTTDAFVYQDEYINFLDQTYPGAFASANNPIMINLDNEPDLWQSTHARLRGDGNRRTPRRAPPPPTPRWSSAPSTTPTRPRT